LPPAAVITICDLFYWSYAKIITESVGTGKRRYGFVIDGFKKDEFVARGIVSDELEVTV